MPVIYYCKSVHIIFKTAKNPIIEKNVILGTCRIDVGFHIDASPTDGSERPRKYID